MFAWPSPPRRNPTGASQSPRPSGWCPPTSCPSCNLFLHVFAGQPPTCAAPPPRGQRRRGSTPRRLTVNWQVDAVDLIALPTSNLEIARWLACATQPPWRRPTPECGSPGSLPVTAGGYLLCGVSAGRAGRQSRPRVSSRACLQSVCVAAQLPVDDVGEPPFEASRVMPIRRASSASLPPCAFL